MILKQRVMVLQTMFVSLLVRQLILNFKRPILSLINLAWFTPVLFDEGRQILRSDYYENDYCNY